MPKKKIPRNVKLNEQSARRLMRGVTLVEMICIMFLVICINIGAMLGSIIIESWYGWLLGGGLGVLAFFIFGTTWAILAQLWSGSGLPKCRNGCCRGPGTFFGFGDEC